MPPGERKRFGGNLLSTVPKAIPDDDEDQAPAAEPAQQPTPAPEPRRPTQGRRARPDRDRPPATVRLHDRAGAQLWEAYKTAKQEDMFLTLTEFASSVMEDGLAAQERRRRS